MSAETFTTDSSSWHDLEALLDGIIVLHVNERERALAELARNRPDAADQLRQWLAAIERSEGFLEPSQDAAAPAPSVLVGVWRLSHPIGRGGMGEVWLAERDDGAFAKQVAIKFIRTDRAGLRERLVQERNVLARLEHPHIARLLDGGIGADGHPYLVTEFVEGIALDRWCRERTPDLDTRLSVFRQIAMAVAHAHANLVVHRDLKSANVLVDAHDRAKLLDFGIAKLLADDTTRDATEHALTPDCAAPEQMTSAPITTRTDIYALGALLYQLLTGQPPLAVRGLSLAELLRRVCEEIPVAPSVVAAHADGVPPRQRSADLDAIVLKALAKRAEERYATVEAMLADIDNAAALRPVTARHATRGYRARRFLRRNKLAVAAAACVACVFALGLAGTLWQAHVAAAERDRAQGELESAQAEMDSNDAADEFLMSLIGGGDDKATSAAVHEVIERGRRFVDNAATTDPAFRAAILGKLAGFAKQAGDIKTMADMVASLRRDYGHAMSLRQQVFSTCSLAQADFYIGENEAGRALVTEGARLGEDLRGSARGALAYCLGGQALYAERFGDVPAALAFAERAVQEAWRLPPSTRARAQQVRLTTILASIKLRSGDVPAALALLEPLRERALGSGLADVGSLVLSSLGDAYESAGRLAEAEHCYEASLAELQGTGRNLAIAYGLVRYARLKNLLEQPLVARQMIERANGMYADLVGKHAATVGHAALELAKAELQLGNYERVTVELDRAEANYRTSLAPHSEFRVYPALIRARLDLALGATDRAQAGVEGVLAQLREWNIEGSSASCQALLAEIALKRGDAASAEDAARSALALHRARLTASDWRIADDEVLLARALAARGRVDEAQGLLDRALPRLSEILGAAHSHTRAAQVQQQALASPQPSAQVADNVD
jgi:eukaryotic-like serine/threonine-protein kinase